jgi:hypothetical protein
MWNVKANVIPVITGQLKIFHTVPEEHTGKARNQGTTKKKQPCWTLHTHFVKYYSKSTKHSAFEVTLYVPYVLTTE